MSVEKCVELHHQKCTKFLIVTISGATHHKKSTTMQFLSYGSYGEDWCDDAKLERFPAGTAAARPLLLVVQPSKESVTKYWPIWQRIPTRRGRLRRETKH